jgi:hypothetical protein
LGKISKADFTTIHERPARHRLTDGAEFASAPVFSPVRPSAKADTYFPALQPCRIVPNRASAQLTLRQINRYLL